MTDDDLEFIKAVDKQRQTVGYRPLTLTEILEVLKKLGWKK